MPLDAICLTALAHELREAVLGGKVDKIYQPARHEVVLAIRGPVKNTRLLLSASPNHPRVQLTAISRENPDAPPMFCMLLRKHLTNGRVLSIDQPPMERVVDMKIEATDELGDRVERHLVLEAMGNHSNLILVDGEGRIMDCLRRVDADMSARRQLLPGMFYHLPPTQEKVNPMTATAEELSALLTAAGEEAAADKWLLNTFGGLSPLICREIAFRACGQTDGRLCELDETGRSKLLAELKKLMEDVGEKRFSPFMLVKDGKPMDFSFLPVLQYGFGAELRQMPSFSAMLDEFYETKENLERVRQRGHDLIRTVTNARDRVARKLETQKKELETTKDRERLRELGDLLTSNLYAMQRGMRVFRTSDYYDVDNREVDIKLNPLLTPQQNAARYYKEYNKAKTAESMLTEQLEKGHRELAYLNSVLENITLAEGERDLQEIRQELLGTGYMHGASKGRAREKKVVSKPMEFRSSAGLRISVGKNNTQNDELTTKQAFKSDLWFHTQKIHGSHVILRTEGGEADEESVWEAATLAAWFSQGRESSNVPVDYTPVKFVKKPNGARPGMVIYTTCKTLFVTPDESLVKKLRVK